MFIKDDSGRFFDPAKASLIEVDKDDTGPIRNYRVKYPGGRSIRVKCNHWELMWALSVVVSAAPDTKAERVTFFRVDCEGQVHYSGDCDGVFTVIAWRFRPDMPDQPEPVLLLDYGALGRENHKKEDFDRYCFEVVDKQ